MRGYLAANFVLMLTVACGPSPDPNKAVPYSVQGTVRNVWCHGQFGGNCDVTFEHETGEITVVRTEGTPPVWTGEHCIMYLEKPCNQCEYDRVVSSRRLP